MDGRKGNKKEERREGGQMNGILDFSCWILCLVSYIYVFSQLVSLSINWLFSL